MDETVTDVLVVGGGPVGLTAASLLTRYGVASITLSKHEDTHPTPRAVFVNQRSVEIFRELGLEDELAQVGIPIRSLGNNVWATTFAGTELARIQAWGTGESRRGEYAATSPCEIFNAPQHVLEPVLLAGARKAGADLRYGMEVTALEQGTDGVVASVLDRRTGAESRVRARYAIVADGAHSELARQTGFEHEAESGVMNWAVNVWLEADLTEYTVHRPALMYCLYEPGSDFHSSTWICLRPWSEWMMSIIYSGSHGRPDIDTASAIEYARAMIGDPDVGITVKAITTWAVDKGVATQFRRDRLLLAGDSAHRHPPPNGLGSNTGVQDAHNLAWKLAMVLSGYAAEELLDTYDTERRPVANTVLDQTMQSLHYMDLLVSALGIEPGQTRKQSWAKLAELSTDDERGRQRRTALQEALRLQEYHYNCHGTEAGHPYSDGALITEDHNSVPVDPELYHEPSTAPGSVLPHAWLMRRSQTLSTMDVTAHGSCTLIVGVGSHEWKTAAERASAVIGVPLVVVEIGHHLQYHDIYGDWVRVRGVNDDGCVLVRPDRRVGWRRTGTSARPADDLIEVMNRLLQREER